MHSKLLLASRRQNEEVLGESKTSIHKPLGESTTEAVKASKPCAAPSFSTASSESSSAKMNANKTSLDALATIVSMEFGNPGGATTANTKSTSAPEDKQKAQTQKPNHKTTSKVAKAPSPEPNHEPNPNPNPTLSLREELHNNCQTRLQEALIGKNMMMDIQRSGNNGNTAFLNMFSAGSQNPAAVSALLAARLAEEQEQFALYIQQWQQQQQQQQQHSSMDLERLKLEHMHRMSNSAMSLYGGAGASLGNILSMNATNPSLGASGATTNPSALLQLDALLGGTNGNDLASLSAQELAVRAQLLQAAQLNALLQAQTQTQAPSSQSHLSMLQGLEKACTTSEAVSATNANNTITNKSKKRLSSKHHQHDHEDVLEQYQHLSKKAKNTPIQRAVANELGFVSSTSNTRGDTTDLEVGKNSKDNTGSTDEDPPGHRFRPYQFEQWTEKFQELCDFRQVKGHCQVPHTYQENPPLARWVKRQRYQYKLKQEGKLSTMTEQRAKLLENIGFIWDSHAAAWAEKLHELKEYVTSVGDCNVPSTYPSNPQLATWVKCQRRQYKLLRDGKASNMTVDRIVELEKLGFVWEVRKSWERGNRNNTTKTNTKCPIPIGALSPATPAKS